MTDLDDLLRDLVADVATAVDPAADAARGRRRLRRRNALVGTTSAVALVAVGGGGLLLHGSTSDASPYAGDPAPSLTATASASASPSTSSITSPSTSSSAPAAPELPSDAMARLQVWRDTLAGYLDPKDEHLQQTVNAMQSGTGPGGTVTDRNGKLVETGSPGRVTTLGTKLNWTDPSHGTGMVEFTVYGHPGKDWSDVGGFGEWNCGAYTAPPGPPGAPGNSTDGWTCHDVRGGVGATRTIYATYPGGKAVAVQHEDGTVVVIDVDQSFGNNGTTDTSPISITEKQLLDAAADPSFTVARVAPGSVS